MRVAYVAGPYRATDQDQLEANIAQARRAARYLWRAGYGVVCPHSNTSYFDEGLADFLAGYLEILGRCDVCVMIPNWHVSEGAWAERALALEKGIGVLYFGFTEAGDFVLLDAEGEAARWEKAGRPELAEAVRRKRP